MNHWKLEKEGIRKITWARFLGDSCSQDHEKFVSTCKGPQDRELSSPHHLNNDIRAERDV